MFSTNSVVTSRGFANFGHILILNKLNKEIPLSLAPSDTIIKTNTITKHFTVDINKRRQWTGEWPFTRPPNSVTFFTGGLSVNDLTGVGIFCEELDQKIEISLGNYVTAFYADLFAILECVKICLALNLQRKNIFICTNCESVLQNLSIFETKSSHVLECFNNLNSLACNNTVNLLWLPGHCGIYGYKYAKNLAKIGSRQAPVGASPLIPLSGNFLKFKIKQYGYQQHQNYWNSDETCQTSKLLLKKPQNEIHKWIINLRKPQLRTLVGAITGHCGLEDHLFTLGLAPDRLCRFCRADAETAYHIICLCPNFAPQRLLNFIKEYLNSD